MATICWRQFEHSTVFRRHATSAAVLMAAAASGCATMNHAQNGALVGGGLGAGTGAIIGHQSGHGEAGALIGGALGVLGGSLAGNAQDAFEQRDAALAELAATNRPMHPPLTNYDLIRMTQSGLGDEVIINAVQTRGGQIDLSPDGLIALKSNGVSDHVLQRVQTAGVPPSPVIPASAVVAAPPPPEIVIVRPRPLVDVHLGPPPIHVDYWHGRPHRFHGPPPRNGFQFSWQHHH